MTDTITMNEAVSNIQRQIETEKKVIAEAKNNLARFEQRGAIFAVQTWHKIIDASQKRMSRLKENIDILTKHEPNVIKLSEAA